MEFLSRMLRRIEEGAFIKAFRVGITSPEGRRVCASHLLFVDDTMLFCDSNFEKNLFLCENGADLL